jgi:hypothetical protein
MRFNQAPAKWAVGEWAEGNVAEDLRRVVKVWAAVPEVEAPNKGGVAPDKICQIHGHKAVNLFFSIFIWKGSNLELSMAINGESEK